MNMILEVYREAFDVLKQKPFRLWGISLLAGFLGGLVGALLGVIPLAALAVAELIEVGMVMVYLHGFRGEEVKAVQLFDCCHDWKTVGRVLAGMGWMTLWIFLWALIPIVGIVFAVIKTYSWRLTPYILVQEPDVAPTEAIKVSAQRTMGYKGKMFGADMLVLACLIVLMVIFAALRLGFLVALVYILALLVLPLFLGLVQAGFYEKISNAPQPKTCAKCGGPVAADASFCPNCGTPV
ncbi:MAG: hypothetical protein IJT07_05645 [Oscillospiraceae bacterium]|nr:hypothetical protein [Oscillospiraceae bacterium]